MQKSAPAIKALEWKSHLKIDSKSESSLRQLSAKRWRYVVIQHFPCLRINQHMKNITCSECGKSIKLKSDLRIAGKLLQPYHSRCLSHPQSKIGKMHKFTGCFPLGVRFWIWILIGNIFVGFVIKQSIDSTNALFLFLIFCNVVYISARLGIYINYEKHLK